MIEEFQIEADTDTMKCRLTLPGIGHVEMTIDEIHAFRLKLADAEKTLRAHDERRKIEADQAKYKADRTYRRLIKGQFRVAESGIPSFEANRGTAIRKGDSIEVIAIYPDYVRVSTWKGEFNVDRGRLKARSVPAPEVEPLPSHLLVKGIVTSETKHERIGRPIDNPGYIRKA